MKNYLIAGAVIAGAVLLSSFLFKPTVPESPLGGSSGQEHSAWEHFGGGISVGGSIMATTSSKSAYTTAAKDFRNAPTVISWLPNVNTTLSISASSTRSWIPAVGDTATVYFRNASTTAAASVTFAAVDSGVDMQFAEATGGDLVLTGLDWAKLTFIRTSTNLVTVIFDEMTEAD